MRVLVTGGTGTLGRHVVSRLLDGGHAVRVLSRRERSAEAWAGAPAVEWAVGDLRAGRGVDAAVAGQQVIVHCATGRGDVAAARQLLDAARSAGSPHLVYISIVGVDRVPFVYYRAKLEVERLVAASRLPFSILRATQFHNLVTAVFGAQRRLPVLMVPARTDVQPVDAGEVATRLAEIAAGEPVGRAPDFGGPEVRHGTDLARVFLAAHGLRRRVVSVWLPGKAGRGYREGGHLAPDRAEGRITFEQFLAAR
jgi:uncharacterized protein YbjT (DUF2867 family)